MFRYTDVLKDVFFSYILFKQIIKLAVETGDFTVEGFDIAGYSLIQSQSFQELSRDLFYW